MQRRNFGNHSGVVVDWCGSHGTWLDPHEMEDIAAFILAGGLEKAPSTGADVCSSLPADPKRVEAVAAAERIMAEERSRASTTEREIDLISRSTIKGIGDLFAQWLK